MLSVKRRIRKYNTDCSASDFSQMRHIVFINSVPLERIVCTDSFSDEKGSVVPATYYYGMNADFRLEMQVTLTFEELEGKTKMVLRHEVTERLKIIPTYL